MLYRPPEEPPCACISFQGGNGLWLKYTWYFGQYKDQDLRSLAEHLCKQQVRYAYFHVRYIKKDGTLRFHFPDEGHRLVKELHQAAPPVRVLAWIYAGNARGSGHVDLANPVVRKAMVGEAMWLVNTCGFDGVHWDYEFPDTGDPLYARLLSETREALPPGKLLSAAVPMWLPAPLRRWGWSDEDFTRIAPPCDQVVVMSYESGLRKPPRYVNLLHEQVVHATKAVSQGNPHCRVLIGLPVFAEKSSSHDPQVENIHNGIQGIKEGLSDPLAVSSALTGVALFADYTASPIDWKEYEELWLKAGSQANH